MTTLNPQVSGLSSASGPTRARLALSAALAVAALGVGGTATGVLVTGSLGSGSAPSAAAPAAPAPAPAAPAPAATPGAPPAATPGVAPAVPAAPAAGVAVVDTRGTALPASTERGARTVFAALESGDVASLRTSYAPTTGGASWAAVQRVLNDTRDRAGLLEAMRSAPQTGAGVPYLYSRDGFRLGLDDAGRIRFVRAP